MIRTLLFILFLVIPTMLMAQRKVLLEEFTGAHCPNCPMGAYYIDSMTDKYPDVIPVALHSYTIPDAMYNSNMDTIGSIYAYGTPLADINRIYGGSGPSVAVYYDQWDTDIQKMLHLPDVLDVSISTLTYDTPVRKITAKVSIHVLTNIAKGDYRVSLFVVEDSVTGSGTGYEQENIYNTTPGNPFYGKGDPITNFVFRHVVRETLPSAWGAIGVIPTFPLAGETYDTVTKYTLPAYCNADKISLVAFVTKYSVDHFGDTVFNVTSAKLPPPGTSSSSGIIKNNSSLISVYPNPVKDEVVISGIENITGKKQIVISDVVGSNIYTYIGSTNENILIDCRQWPEGIYFLKLQTAENLATVKIIK